MSALAAALPVAVRRLDLRGNGITGKAGRAVAEGVREGVEELNLGRNGLGDDGGREIVKVRMRFVDGIVKFYLHLRPKY